MSFGVVSVLLGLLILAAPGHATVITVNNPSPGSYLLFGNSIDSASGLLVVGLPEFNGAVGEVFVFDATTGSLVMTIANPNPQSGEGFGGSVEAAGNLLVVSAPGEDVNGIQSAGQVYIFNVETGSLLDTLTSSSPRESGGFGRTVVLADGLLAVGAPFETVNGLQAGRVHIFDLKTGFEIMTLVSPNPEDNGIFGAKIDISGGHMIVSAPGENHLTGRTYVFSTSNGALFTSLVSPNAPNEVFFGSSVALRDHLALVGSPSETINGVLATGSVYAFDVNTGSLVRTFVDPNPLTAGRFGFSLKPAGNSLIVGAPSDMVGPTTVGRAYIFNTASGSLTATLVSPDTGIAGSPGLFGNAVDSANDRIYVGAPAQFVNGQLWAGAVYVFN